MYAPSTIVVGFPVTAPVAGLNAKTWAPITPVPRLFIRRVMLPVDPRKVLLP